nr:2-dehydropantoate 2-reductase [Photobacterium galatheae]
MVGAGAIGSLWAGALAKQGHSLHLWRRQPGSTYTLNWQGSHLSSAETFSFDCNQPHQLADSNIIIITVKAFQVTDAVTTLLPWLSAETPVVIMHNGMGTEDEVLTLLPDNPVIYATTAQAAFRPDPHSVRHTGNGPTYLGGVNRAGQECAALAELLHAALPPCHWQTDIHAPQWQKLAINCAVNPLTAIHQCRNGDLSAPCYADELTAICQEVSAVMTAAGYPVTTDALRQQVITVINATATNYSSMQQDVAHQRPTEIDAITGFLIQQANHFQIATPVNTRLWQQIKDLEQHYG